MPAEVRITQYANEDQLQVSTASRESLVKIIDITTCLYLKTLENQLHDPLLFRLWRTGAFLEAFEPAEDGDEIPVRPLEP